MADELYNIDTGAFEKLNNRARRSAKNLDDFADATESLVKHVNNIVNQFKANSLDQKLYNEAFKKVTQNIFAFKDKWAVNLGYGKAAQEGLKKYVAKGNDLNAALNDEQELTLLRVKIFRDYAAKTKLSKTKILEQEERIVKETKLEFEKRNAATKIYDKVTGKVSDLLGNNFVGRAFNQYTENNREKNVGRIENNLGSTNMLSSLIDKMGGLAKFALVAGALGAAIAFVVDKLMQLVGGILEFNSVVTKQVGTTSKIAGELLPNIQNAGKEVQTYFGGDFIAATKESAEASGSLVKNFGTFGSLSKDNIVHVISLSERLGISKDEAAAFVKTMQLGLGFNNKQMRDAEISLQAQSEIAGVSYVNALKDIKDNSEFIALYTDRSWKNIEQAAIQAQKLGSSLADQAALAGKFSTIGESVQSAYELSLLTGKNFSALSLYSTARFGNNADIANMQAQMLDSIISKEQSMGGMIKDRYLREKLASYVSGGDANKLNEMIALRKKEQGIGLTAEDKAMIKNRQETAKIEKEASEKMKSTRSFATALGILELKSPQEIWLAKITQLLQEQLIPTATLIAEYTLKAATWLEVQIRSTTKYGILSGLLRGAGMNELATIIEAQGAAHEGINAIGTDQYWESQVQNKIKPHAMGGVVNRPSIAGEAGPEAILPLTGPGASTFTKPFMKAATESGNKEVLNAIKELMAMLSEKQINVISKTYLDSHEIASGLTKVALKYS